MNDNSTMPFGMYQGRKLANVPASYLLWMLDVRKCSGDLKKYIEENKDVLEKEVEKSLASKQNSTQH